LTHRTSFLKSGATSPTSKVRANSNVAMRVEPRAGGSPIFRRHWTQVHASTAQRFVGEHCPDSSVMPSPLANSSMLPTLVHGVSLRSVQSLTAGGHSVWSHVVQHWAVALYAPVAQSHT